MEGSREAQRVERGEKSQAGPPSALGHCESGLPWGPEDTQLSARPELQSEPRIAQYPVSMHSCALLWHKQPEGSKGLDSRAGPVASRALESETNERH